MFIRHIKKTARGEQMKQGVSNKPENYSSRFPKGIQTEEIQPLRQTRSWPGGKETLNIFWGDKNHCGNTIVQNKCVEHLQNKLEGKALINDPCNHNNDP